MAAGWNYSGMKKNNDRLIRKPLTLGTQTVRPLSAENLRDHVAGGTTRLCAGTGGTFDLSFSC